ncbi:MAG: bifunctional glutamate N-acetyltransferase/amino-acid acetyltransferase ArgJ [Caulobacterales bacterium]
MKGGTVSPLAPARTATPPAVSGVLAATGRAGYYKHNRPDLVLFAFPPGTRAAGVFTRHSVGSAPVDWSKAGLKVTGGAARGLLVNAGCANAFTGVVGAAATKTCAQAVATRLAVEPESILAASTGVIGVPLDASKATAALPGLMKAMGPANWLDAAKAIMTTDTFAKVAGATTQIGAESVAIAGIAKGSGMIAPDMATMLAFVFTDARLPAPVLNAILRAEAATSFNSITVDGDRSTNDCLILVATGAAKTPTIRSAADQDLAAFRAALSGVLSDLAIQIVRDGEGATKLVTVHVTGAANTNSAKRIARSICESPLVKTAIAGEDANWGRITMAVGKADEPVNRDRLSIKFGPLWAAKDGAVARDYSEAAMSAYMKGAELEITVDVGVGAGRATMYTCDLTKRYIEINGDYRS